MLSFRPHFAHEHSIWRMFALACVVFFGIGGISFSSTTTAQETVGDPFEKTDDPLNNFNQRLKQPQNTPADNPVQNITDPLFSLPIWVKKDTPMAIFRRGRNLWLVIKKPGAFHSSKINEVASRYIHRIEDISTNNETVIRMVIDKDINPSLFFTNDAENSGRDAVLLNFHRQPIHNEREIHIQIETDKLGGSPYILIADRQGNGLIEMIDPEIGQRIVVMPSHITGYGIPQIHDYPDATILQSLQGSAVLLKREDIKVRHHDFGFTIRATDILNISVTEGTQKRDLSELKTRFLDAEEWSNVPISKIVQTRDDLMYRVVQSPAQKRTSPRHALARFFLSIGWGAEALSVLEFSAEKDPSFARTHDHEAYVIVANYLMRRYDEVSQKISSPKYANFRDVGIWRAALHAHKEEWLNAFNEFLARESILRRYPKYLRIRLGLLFIQSAMQVKRYEIAQTWISVLKKDLAWFTGFQRHTLDYVEGQLLLARNNWLDARNKFEKLAKVDDLDNQLAARYALISMDRREKNTSDEEIVKRLQTLRADARQTKIEVVILQQIVDVMLKKRDYLSAMRLMRMMTTLDIGQQFNRDLVTRMQLTLNDLFLDMESQRSTLPIRTIAIFDEFRELTPVGEKGNRIISGLVGHLIRMDLLDQAEDMLAYQIRYRVFGNEKIRLGTKLAVVALLNNNPSLALKALNETQFGIIGREISRHRRLLRAKALESLGEKQQALKQLAGDITMEADLIRREIFWGDKDWVELAKTIRRLITSIPSSEEGGLSELQARYVLNWIVALQMQNNTVGVQEVISQYRDDMLQSKYAPVFAFLVADSKRGSTNAIQRVLAEGEVFQEFLDTYQRELLADSFDDFVLEGVGGMTNQVDGVNNG